MNEPIQNRPSKREEQHGLDALGDALQRSFKLLRTAMIALLALYLVSGIFIVRQHEKAVTLTLGKIAGTGDDRILEPGLHWTWPKPFAEVVRLPAGRVWSLTTRTAWHGTAEGQRARATLRPLVDGATLAGDANLLHSEWAVRFTIDDPAAWLFHATDPEGLMERELNRAVVHVSARMPVDGLLRTDLEAFRQGVEQQYRLRLAVLDLGVRVQGVDLLRVSPPLQVAGAFDDVIEAEQAKARAIADARAYAARTVNEAQGEADQRIAAGETDKSRLVNEVKAHAAYFTEIAPSVARRPNLMRRILQQDGIQAALATAGEVYILPSDDDGRREIRLQLSPRRQNPFGARTP